MSDKSPLFVSALELLAHATELFAQKNEKNINLSFCIWQIQLNLYLKIV